MVWHALLVVHVIHGSLRLSFIGEPDETESTAAQSVMVLDNDLIYVNTGSSFAKGEGGGRREAETPDTIRTASSMAPNCENPSRRVSSVVCHARPLVGWFVSVGGVIDPMKREIH